MRIPSVLGKRRSTASGLLIGASALLLASAASAATWRTLSSAAEGFVAEFSGTVTRKPTDVAAGLKPHVARAVTFEQAEPDLLLAVGVQHMKRPMQLDGVVDASFDTLGCGDRRPAEPLPVRGASARELRGEGCLGGEMSVVLRHYTRGADAYQVLVIFIPTRRAEATRFLDSFRLLAPAVGSRSRTGVSARARPD